VNVRLAEDLFARAGNSPVITKRDLAHFRADREKDCARNDPEYSFGVKRQAGAYAEAAALLLGMGDSDTATISVSHARSFLVNERFPDDFKKSEKVITKSHAAWLAGKLKVRAMVGR